MAHVPAERCLGIIEYLADDARELPLGAIADGVGLPKSGAHRLLATLVDQGWVEQDPQTGFYRLTMKLALLGQRYYVATGLPDICQPVLDRLAAQCREFVRMSVADGESLVWIAHAQGRVGGLMYQPTAVSVAVPLYATATGKVFLASLPIDEALRRVEHNGGFDLADQYGPNVIRTMDALLADLRLTGERGWGLAVNEAEPGVTAVAAPIRLGSRGAAVGTVSIAGPTARVPESRVREWVPMVMASAAELSALWPQRSRTEVRGETARPAWVA